MSTYADADGDTVRLDSIERAIADIRDGKAVVVVDDPGRENEGDIIFAASKATPELMGFLIRHSSGYVCAPAPGAVLDRLGIPLMTPHNRELMRTAYTISVDARDGITTGISAADRARTVRVLADSATESFELVMPGHVLPLRAKDGGVLARAGHTEAAVDLTRLAGLTPVGVIGEVVHDDGELMRAPALRAFADEHDLALVSIEDLQVHLRLHESQVERLAETSLPTEFGAFRALGYRDRIDGAEHVALVHGDVDAASADGQGVLVRLHSECLTGDVFGSRRCDCGPQLQASMAKIKAEGAGVVVYLRGHEGRGIGLLHKLQAYALQDAGSDTVDANLALGFGEDERDYAAGAQMLRDLGLRSVRLLTNNPDKATQLEAYGVKVAERVPIQIEPTPENIQYLRTKAERMGHDLPDLGLGDTTEDES
ncbi:MULTISPECIES: bifunctional 3,4-dihydroxy-2-butanone-4-phosphate synthase/GTP cyclohydrolase II [unclassified Aeromicrobium]|uniref:bifunctional 3,4-dihydroxy-2-butanone-4-phosphate synthase/GTP cyclohydrolase II n=1 Tax=unclassified Aeromicrobium TaxID=2633570 RepID=UPI002097D1D6|nr:MULTISPECIES: bifunctional 3,4-dihydroxy-2-butanone-4-phosphate synthase/GTP cyclohydrolase II [unclassified Aeromicrobium]MCO7239416.1 bifunctional 3,4-dihydroxy-2-butanone-4-phosphate synthase/GTP cyclohydrolase II [Aeromicrobium sp. CnD17-E]MDR6119609.1 3,4-dihydroxy 2-butanone 4-phosphate synthase/GTP cyclohydrolase II [Aeromicrobium sp. SORGH_AS_0981]